MRMRSNFRPDASPAAPSGRPEASEKSLAEERGRVEGKRWCKENSGAIQSYNRFLDEHGLPLEGMRLF